MEFCSCNEMESTVVPVPMTENLKQPGQAEKKIEDFLRVLSTAGGLNLKSNIIACNGQVQPTSSDPAGALPVRPVQSPSSSDTDPQTTPEITVELSGPDTPLLLARNGELLLAIEHIAAKILRLESEEHDRISFDAEGFKATRNRELDLMAEMAIQKVRATGEPYSFSPMTSRERRILHLALAKSGLPTASSGTGPGRFVVLYPEGLQPAPPAAPSAEDRTRAIRNSFRRR
jgi:spoIIIJ-associated protein